MGLFYQSRATDRAQISTRPTLLLANQGMQSTKHLFTKLYSYKTINYANTTLFLHHTSVQNDRQKTCVLTFSKTTKSFFAIKKMELFIWQF